MQKGRNARILMCFNLFPVLSMCEQKLDHGLRHSMFEGIVCLESYKFEAKHYSSSEPAHDIHARIVIYCIFFERKIFNSVVGVFSFVVKLSMARRVHKSAESLVSYIIQVSGVTAVGKPEVAGLNAAVGHTIIFTFFQTLINTFLFFNSKI